ncbi:MAG TPA: ISNCY family transposase [Pseudacidobacterium sp.]|nr:ISNCY family transposase [Pseudacidobacterium sp.]
MGWVTMSERDLQRIEVLTEVLAGRRTVASAATVLEISPRQTRRLLNRYQDGGGSALIHQARGRKSNHRLQDGIREYALELVRRHYRDFGPSLATEALQERHGLKVGRETVRKWMVEDGLWLSRKQRRSFHQPRLRREHYGELIQIDGSEHRWFEDRAKPCTLLVFIDDATGKLMQLRFVPSESTDSYFQALHGYLQSHGCPVAFYSDKHSVFRMNRDAKGGQGMTQFGSALAELNIEILCANSSQAKGRVERANRTLQDRLVKELRLADISSIDAGNEFLHGFVERFNAKFAIEPARSENLHRPLNLAPNRLKDILCYREQRYVGAQLTFHYDRKQIILDRNDISESLAGKYVELYDYFDRPLEVRWKGVSLPYRVFSKDQRVNHTAIVENKRLGHALALVKAQQDLRLAPKVMTNSEKTGYRKRVRKVPGTKEMLKVHPAQTAAENTNVIDSAAVR